MQSSASGLFRTKGRVNFGQERWGCNRGNQFFSFAIKSLHHFSFFSFLSCAGTLTISLSIQGADQDKSPFCGQQRETESCPRSQRWSGGRASPSPMCFVRIRKILTGLVGEYHFNARGNVNWIQVLEVPDWAINKRVGLDWETFCQWYSRMTLCNGCPRVSIYTYSWFICIKNDNFMSK